MVISRQIQPIILVVSILVYILLKSTPKTDKREWHIFLSLIISISVILGVNVWTHLILVWFYNLSFAINMSLITAMFLSIYILITILIYEMNTKTKLTD